MDILKYSAVTGPRPAHHFQTEFQLPIIYVMLVYYVAIALAAIGFSTFNARLETAKGQAASLTGTVIRVAGMVAVTLFGLGAIALSWASDSSSPSSCPRRRAWPGSGSTWWVCPPPSWPGTWRSSPSWESSGRRTSASSWTSWTRGRWPGTSTGS